MTLTLGLLAPSAGATHVDAVLIDETSFPSDDFPGINYQNPTCGALGFAEEVKIDPFPPSNPTGPLTFSNATEQTFDFTSTERVSAVVVKAADEGWLYNYLPSGTFGDTGLISPDGHDISHLSFCFGGTTPEESTTTTEATTTTTEATTTTAPPTTAPPTTAAAEVEDTVVEQTAPPTSAKVLGETLARTGSDVKGLLLMAGLALALGGTAVYFGESPAAARRRR